MNYLIDNEICPSCDEKWIQGYGLDCANNCEHKQLEEKHRRVAKPTVDYLLPNWRVNVDCPNDWIEPKEGERIKWGVSNAVSRNITIPWYTLRNEKMFFPTVPHECSHISAYEKKYGLRPKEKNIFKGLNEIIQQHNNLVNEYNNLPLLTKNHPQIREGYQKRFREDRINYYNYYQKHKKIFDAYLKEQQASHGNHWEDPWYSDYVDYHKTLMSSQYARYNYDNDPPLSLEESWGWEC